VLAVLASAVIAAGACGDLGGADPFVESDAGVALDAAGSDGGTCEPLGVDGGTCLYGAPTAGMASAMVLDGDENVVIAGARDFGCAADAGAIEIAKLDRQGRCAWGHSATVFDAYRWRVGADRVGNVVVSGSSENGGLPAGTLGCPDLAMEAGSRPPSAFVAKLDSSGRCVWSKVVPAAGLVATLDASGNVAVLAALHPSFDWGCGVVSTTNAPTVLTLARLAADGSCLWSKQIGDTVVGDNPMLPGWFLESPAIAANASGEIAVIGAAYSSVALDFGCGPIAPPPRSTFVAKVDSNGKCIFSRAAPRARDDWSDSANVAINATGDVALAIMTSASLSALGCGDASGEMTSLRSVVASFDASGRCTWGRRTKASAANLIAIDRYGNVVVSGGGPPPNTVDFGCDAAVALPEGALTYVAKLDPSGTCTWIRTTMSGAVAVRECGDVVVSAWLPADPQCPNVSATEADAGYALVELAR
jgi:hypothetical protein